MACEQQNQHYNFQFSAMVSVVRRFLFSSVSNSPYQVFIPTSSILLIKGKAKLELNFSFCDRHGNTSENVEKVK
jgi:hypothetical protein